MPGPATPQAGYWKSRPRAPAVGTVLGPADAIAEGSGKEYKFGQGHSAFRMFVVRHGGEVFGYLNICPHYSSPLNIAEDQFMTDDGTSVMCRRHFALFNAATGLCFSGACVGNSLDTIPVAIRDGLLEISA